ncbi:phage Gp37/Gp68 family protein [Sphingobium sp. LMC3-1-1.1]|uniref:phage Gp37/Gp68 family protein n=1 Tax=Sphingobium sp. LMC3-1-1.1 TaxID=3135241 RepID=UPI0034461EFB
MADRTRIEWTDATVNAINGCSVLSPGCTNCYAMRLAGTRLKHHPSRAGLTIDSKAGPVWNGEVRLNEDQLLQPLRWAKPRRIFWNAHGDMFHPAVPDEWIDRCFAVMAMTPQHIHQVLTKRAERMRAYMERACGRIADTIISMRRHRGERVITVPLDHVRPGASWWPLPNVWLGVSVEDQARALTRIPDLLATPAAVRWLSCEPLLGPIYLTDIADGGSTVLDPECWGDCNCSRLFGYDPGCRRAGGDGTLTRKIDWVVAGGESGPDARPMHPAWTRTLRDDCAQADVPFFFKQWGSWIPVCAMSEDLIDSCYHPAPARHPEASRRCKVDSHILHDDGSQHHFLEDGAFLHGTGAMQMMAVGKGKAGRLLDGIQHDGMPT